MAIFETEYAPEAALNEMQDYVTTLCEELFDERIKLLISATLNVPVSLTTELICETIFSFANR